MGQVEICVEVLPDATAQQAALFYLIAQGQRPVAEHRSAEIRYAIRSEKPFRP